MKPNDNVADELGLMSTRRQLLGRAATGIASIALASLLNENLFAGTPDTAKSATGAGGFPNFPPKAKRVIYLFQSGAPSQFELLDHKPALEKRHGQELDAAFFKGQRQTGMTARQKKQVCKSIYKFSKHGQRARRSASCFRTLPKSPMTSASFARCKRTRSITIRRSRSFRRDFSRLVGQVWGRGSATDWEVRTPTCQPTW